MRSQVALGVNEFVKGELWHFDHDVIKNRLKASLCLFGDEVGNFVQVESNGDKRGHFRDWVAGGLRCERRRARNAGIHFDYGVFKAVGV